MTIFKLVNIALTYKCNKNCDYCYSSALSNEYKDITEKDFLYVLKWLKACNITKFNFIGGEPTVHTKIADFFKLSYKHGFKLNISTNLTFDKSILRSINDDTEFFVSLMDPASYTNKEYENFISNLSYVADRKNIFNFIYILREKNNIAHIVSLVKKYRPCKITLNYPAPNSYKSNYFIDKNELHKYEDKLMDIVSKMDALGITTDTSRAYPRCCFSNKNIRFSSLCLAGENSFVINPDLSIFPCVSLFLKGPSITTISDPEKFIPDYYIKKIDKLRWKNILYEKCNTCAYYHRKKCQGGCLNYKIP
ncbi:MAG: radical SAM protein [archaeon]